MTVLERDILAALKPHANKARAAHDIGYVKSRFTLLGCNMPSIRSVAKTFMSASTAELDQTWNTSTSFDVLYVLLIILSEQPVLDSHWPMMKRWSKKIDNWAHSDMLSDMIAQLLETQPDRIYPDLARWNASTLPWRRRLSLTSLLYYSSKRTCLLPANKILPLVKARLKDSDLYVQKAVGWTLREAGNCYPDVVETFIKKHVTQLSPVAFTSATEKWSANKKEPLEQLRKRLRSSAP